MPRSRLPILRRDLSTSAYAGVTDAAIPSGSFLAWCHAMSDAFSDTQQRFVHRIKDGRVCHTLLPTLNKFEKVSNSPTQGRELKANPDILDLLRNRIPDISHVPMSLKETVAVERSLKVRPRAFYPQKLPGGPGVPFPSFVEIFRPLPIQELQTLRFPRDRFWPGAMRCQMPSLTHNRDSLIALRMEGSAILCCLLSTSLRRSPIRLLKEGS